MLTLEFWDLPEDLQRLSSPPSQLYCRGATLTELLRRPRVAVIGSRLVTDYGRQVTMELAGELAKQGVVIISGLALGVDSLAHRAALEAGGLTIAVLPGPVDSIYPMTNTALADQIVARGGALVSEYAAQGRGPEFKARCVARNRLVAGLAQAVLITEAAGKSGSLHTARFALEQGKDVLAVPGNITARQSVGANNLIKAGAAPVTSYVDVLHALGLEAHQTAVQAVRGRNADEQCILDLLLQGVGDGQDLLKQSRLSVSDFNQVLTMLEISGRIRALGANHWALF